MSWHAIKTPSCPPTPPPQNIYQENKYLKILKTRDDLWKPFWFILEEGKPSCASLGRGSLLVCTSCLSGAAAERMKTTWRQTWIVNRGLVGQLIIWCKSRCSVESYPLEDYSSKVSYQGKVQLVACKGLLIAKEMRTLGTVQKATVKDQSKLCSLPLEEDLSSKKHPGSGISSTAIYCCSLTWNEFFPPR